MDIYAARKTLKMNYDEVLLTYEELSDKAEEFASHSLTSELKEAKTWLENATASLIPWGLDIKVDAGSLAAIEGTHLGSEVHRALKELHQQVEAFSRVLFNERGAGDRPQSPERVKGNDPGERSEGGNTMSNGSKLQSFSSSHRDRSTYEANEDPMAIMSSLIGDLQGLVRPIRMAHASKNNQGPYRNLKRQIDIIYNRHMKGRTSAEIQAQNTVALTMLDVQDASHVSGDSNQILPVEESHLRELFPKVQDDVGTKPLERFCNAQQVFLAIRINFTQDYVQYEDHAVLPIQCDPDGDLLGHGAFGDIYKVRISSEFLETSVYGERFAMKCFVGFPRSGQAATRSKTILKHMKMLDHPSLMRHISSWTFGSNTYVLFPIASTGVRDLLDKETPPMTATGQLRVLEQMLGLANALRCLHSHGSSNVAQNQFLHNQQSSLMGAHMNVKPENILIMRERDGTERWKIADFGQSKLKSDWYLSQNIIHILSPTAGDQGNIGKQHDIFALGLVFSEIFAWLLGDQKVRHELFELDKLRHTPMTDDFAQKKLRVVAVLKEMSQTERDNRWLDGILDLIRSGFEINAQQGATVPNLDVSLAHLLALAPKSSHHDLPKDDNSEIVEDEDPDGSESSSIPSDIYKSGTETPDTVHSMIDDPVPQLRVQWQTQRMYPFLLHGLEPEPIHDEISTSLKKYVRLKQGPRPSNEYDYPDVLVIERAMLRSLCYPGMRDREQQVDFGHEGTCSWLFEDDESLLMRWLKRDIKDAQVFWIQGKPGSGKSTLMKQAQWHFSGPPFRTITHFFSLQGTAMDKAQVGLLRSILHQLLCHRSELLGVLARGTYLLSDMWQIAFGCTASDLAALPIAWHNWSLFQLRRLLHEVLSLSGSCR
ncbi:MAG: hypothetical protein Q9170_002900 [Blastenia crenularia]